MELTKEVLQTLAAPFSADEVEFLPKAQSNGKALGLAYIDARAVMNRLDFAVGPAHWSFDYDLMSPDGKMVKGRLTVCGVTKCDAGEAGSEEELLKSAVSDAIKRCAVHFGIGRYLYYLPRVWAPYDAQKRRFTEPPKHENRDIAKALACCGFGEHRAQPESRGDQRATQRPTPNAQEQPTQPQPRVQQAVVANEQARSYAEEAGVTPKAPDPRAKYFALLREHGCDMTVEVRHLFNGEIGGKPGTPCPTKNWGPSAWGKFLPKLEQHLASGCPGGGFCDVLQAAQDLAASQTPDSGFKSALATP